MTLSEFDAGKQATFREAIADAAGVWIADVTIIKVASISSARRGEEIRAVMRRLLASGIRIDMIIKRATQNTAAKLTITVINNKLQQVGLPAATILEAPKTAASGEVGGTTSSPSGGGLDDRSTSGGTSSDGASWVLPVIISGASVGFLVLGLAFRWYNQKKLQRHLKALSDLASAELGSVTQPTNTPQFEAPSEVFLEDGQDGGQVELGMRPSMMAYRDLGTSSAQVPSSHQV